MLRLAFVMSKTRQRDNGLLLRVIPNTHRGRYIRFTGPRTLQDAPIIKDKCHCSTRRIHTSYKRADVRDHCLRFYLAFKVDILNILPAIRQQSHIVRSSEFLNDLTISRLPDSKLFNASGSTVVPLRAQPANAMLTISTDAIFLMLVPRQGDTVRSPCIGDRERMSEHIFCSDC
jgi:hypothetical protein